MNEEKKSLWQSTAAMREELSYLRMAVEQAKKKMGILEELREFVQAYGEDPACVEIFTALLAVTMEIQAQADELADAVAELEEQLGDALWYCSVCNR